MFANILRITFVYFASLVLVGCVLPPQPEGWPQQGQSNQPVSYEYNVNGTWSFIDGSGKQMVNEIWRVNEGIMAKRQGTNRGYLYLEIDGNLFQDEKGQTYEFYSDQEAGWRGTNNKSFYLTRY